jgi:hypothetical protein
MVSRRLSAGGRGQRGSWHYVREEVHNVIRLLMVLWLASAVVGAASPAAAELRPMMAGWERLFAVDWEPARHRGQPVVQGYVTNVSPYHTTNIRVLVESLDAGGQVTSQRIAWLPGDLLGGGRAFFQVPAAPAPAFRVQIFSYDRVELDGPFR